MSRWSTKTSLPAVTFLYDTYVLLESDYSVLAIGPPYSYVIRPHIVYVSVLVYIASKQYVDRLYNGDCYASPSIFGTH